MLEGTAVGYDCSISRAFAFATILFGILGLLMGVIIAWQLVYPDLNNLAGQYGTYGRLKPLYTNIMMYGFTLSAVFATWYYIGQRALKVSMRVSPFLMKVARLHFVLYFITIFLAVATLSAGITTAKQYASLSWIIDLLVMIWWILWGVSIFGLMRLRGENIISVSVWYYIATYILFGIVYIFSNIEIPTMFFADGAFSNKMYSIPVYIGSSDTMAQWWQSYDVAKVITIFPIVAMIYYFLPKQSGQNIYSHKLASLSFWGLVSLFFWTGGQNLAYLLVPNMMQTISLTVSVIFVSLLWGVAINLLLTFRGEWNTLVDNSILKFFVAGVLFFMLYTIQYIKPVRDIASFTDWNTHFAMIGWVGFVVTGGLYHVYSHVYKRQIDSKRLVAIHFWLQTVAVLIYFSSMLIAGIVQDIMWKSYDEYGSLTYSFVDIFNMLLPYHIAKAVAVSLYLLGFVIFAISLFKTTTSGKTVKQHR